MSVNNNINEWTSYSDPAVVERIGAALKSIRLNKNLTQQEVADRSGLDRITIGKLENGASASLLTFVQILRALDVMYMLNVLDEQPSISPLQMAKLRGKMRKRASGKRPDASS